MSNFNPNDLGLDNGNLFGLPKDFSSAECVVFPVPWDVTVSYSDGTSHSPQLIQKESLQVDLFDLDYKNFWEKGIYFTEISKEIFQKSKKLRPLAKEVIKLMMQGETIETNNIIATNTAAIHEGCRWLLGEVRTQCNKILAEGKKLVLLGGDHSTPLGYIQALAERHTDFGILQIDAHLDLREAYEGFEYSHASIMYNALKTNSVSGITTIGIRDFCEEELNLTKNSAKPIHVFFDRDMKRNAYKGINWHQQCEKIVETLPKKIYISFDIDGLNPALCPHTGTPVAGGLEVDQVFYLFDMILKKGIAIIGADLNEVGNAVWDANVGARVLYRLLGTIMS